MDLSVLIGTNVSKVLVSNYVRQTWPSGVSIQTNNWTINTNVTPPGKYVFKGVVRNPATGYVMAETPWLAATQAVHVCRGNPVILVHGIGDNGVDCWGDMAVLLRDSNDLATVSFDYRGMTAGTDEAARAKLGSPPHRAGERAKHLHYRNEGSNEIPSKMRVLAV